MNRVWIVWKPSGVEETIRTKWAHVRDNCLTFAPVGGRDVVEYIPIRNTNRFRIYKMAEDEQPFGLGTVV